jgi:hypothetical protein
MKLFKKEEREPVRDEAFAYRLGAITHRTKSSVDPYGRHDGPDPIAA